MNENSKQLQEIADLEQWLAKVLPDGERQSMEHLKLRMRVELNEQWLGAQWRDPAAGLASDRLHEAVRAAALDSTRRVFAGTRRHGGTWHWIAGAGLGLAAMLFFSVARFRAGQMKALDLDDDVFAFEEASTSEAFDDELQEALAEIDDLLASRDETEWEAALDGL